MTSLRAVKPHGVVKTKWLIWDNPTSYLGDLHGLTVSMLINFRYDSWDPPTGVVDCSILWGSHKVDLAEGFQLRSDVITCGFQPCSTQERCSNDSLSLFWDVFWSLWIFNSPVQLAVGPLSPVASIVWPGRCVCVIPKLGMSAPASLIMIDKDNIKVGHTGRSPMK